MQTYSELSKKKDNISDVLQSHSRRESELRYFPNFR
jgi:hypothetical protein